MTSDVPHVLIRASAGTGKTFRLSNHYLAQLLRGTSPDDILAMTFTRKAAGEILERIFARLVNAAGSTDESEALSEFLGHSVTPDSAAALVHQLARQMHQIRISTYDAFQAKLATAYALEFGLPADWRVLDEHDVPPLRLRAIDDVLNAQSSDEAVELLGMLDKGDVKRGVIAQIHSAVTKFHEVYLETDGKLRPWDQVPECPPVAEAVIAEAVAALEEHGPTFPHKSVVKAMAGLVRAVKDDHWKTVTEATAVRAAFGDGVFHRKPLTDELIAALQTLGRQASALALLELRLQNHATHELLHAFDQRFYARKLETAGLTFGDVTRQIGKALETSSGSPMSADEIGFRLDGEVRHLLLDEFQDTSLGQWQVLQPIVERIAAHNNGSVFCVGDLKQAIYGWRGGVAAIFDRIESELDIKPQAMDRSFRSAKKIIQTVNQIFGRLPEHTPAREPDRVAMEQWHARYVQHETDKDALGYAEVRVTPQPESATAKFGHDIRRWTASFVRDLHDTHPTRTIGVLTSRNSVASEIVAHLRALGVTASDEGRERLTDSAAVQLLCSLFTLADHPSDTAARFHVATSPLTTPTGLSAYENDDEAAALSDRLRREFLDDGYAAAVHHWASFLIDSAGRRDVARLRQLIALADEYDRSTRPSPAEFLRLVRETKSGDPVDTAVRVMTVHQSKGLEFDLVVLTELDRVCYDLSQTGFVAARPEPASPPDRIHRHRGQKEQALFPKPVRDVFDQAATAAMAEALCKFYVAVTRAESAITFLVPPDAVDEKGGRVKRSSSDALRCSELVRTLLCDGAVFEPETVAWSDGNANWDHTTSPSTSVENTAPVAIPLAKTSATVRNRPSVSPSSLAEHASSTATLTRRQIAAPFGRGEAAARGTLIHRWFEELRWLEDAERLSAERRLRLANGLDIVPEMAVRESAAFEEILALPVVRKILDRDRYAATVSRPVLEARTEVQFAMLADPGRADSPLVNGSVDRLVLLGTDSVTGAEVIDWKTDYIPDAQAVADKVAHYRPQLAAYVEAVRRLYDLPPDAVTARLVFLDGDCDVVLTDSPSTMAPVAAESSTPHQPASHQPVDTLFPL